MIKQITILMLCLAIAQASQIFRYENGLIKDRVNLKYALGIVEISEKKYKKLSSEEAINELAKKLYSNISTNTVVKKILDDNQESLEYYSNYNIKVNLPLIGIEVSERKKESDKYYTLVKFDYVKNREVYKKATNQKAREINELYAKLKKSNKQEQQFYYKEILKKLEVYNKFYFISLLIGVDDLLESKISTSEATLALMQLDKESSFSVDAQVQRLVKKLDTSKINGSVKILPVTYGKKSSYSIYSSDVQNKLINQLTQKHTVVKNNAKYTISGYYYVGSKDITTYINLYDNNGQILSVSSAKLKLPNTKTYYSPKIIKEDTNTKLSNKLVVKAKINSSTEHQLLREGEEVSLEAYASKECYIYVVDTFIKNGIEYQVMLQLKDADSKYDKTQFEYKVTSDEKRKFIPFGKFKVASPFGEEKLTFIASTKSILDSINISYKNIDGTDYALYKVDGKIVKNTIDTTRGIVRQKTQSKDASNGEYSIKFTTVK